MLLRKNNIRLATVSTISISLTFVKRFKLSVIISPAVCLLCNHTLESNIFMRPLETLSALFFQILFASDGRWRHACLKCNKLKRISNFRVIKVVPVTRTKLLNIR